MTMLHFQAVEPLRAQIEKWRSKDEKISFVPTMGNLHDGHLSLVDIAQRNADRVVVSIYVNPLQFSPDEDFSSYPRTIDEDMEKLDALGVDLVFTPESALIYPNGEQSSSFVEVPVLSHIIEGEFRPNFFRGVTTVVLKLLNIVQPDIAVFGEKDFQQLMIINKMVKDLCLPVRIIGGETRREDDGLAMSSRNTYLTSAERETSALLSQALMVSRDQIVQGLEVSKVEESCSESLKKHGFSVDYVTIRETTHLAEISDDEVGNIKELIILAAVRIGKTRLIDNVKFNLT